MRDAWDALLEATPPGWYVGRPSYHDRRREWVKYAFDPSERAVVGVRQREWEAVADSELGCRARDGAVPARDCGREGPEVNRRPWKSHLTAADRKAHSASLDGGL